MTHQVFSVSLLYSSGKMELSRLTCVHQWQLACLPTSPQSTSLGWGAPPGGTPAPQPA